ncbi:MAG: transcription initiation factor IIB family protein [Candidatus Micrarchaeota archaeon]|nr:transcription initiation factor IIB family protein [Candidatus Micrarchaeota archaeon]MDE1847873.1 transcription initiation factor IIB family protein [Candidatus Micrarchaeota archaeon]MDE1864200.1 transcription initiation factor IIB family protein [Candidatus Micrarchaeota archaeon]
MPMNWGIQDALPGRRKDDECPECKGTLIEDKDHGERVCVGCGYVSSQLIADPDLKERTLPVSYSNASTIGPSNADYSGKRISGVVRNRIENMRLEDWRSKKSGTARKLDEALPNLIKWTGLLGMPDVAVTHTFTILTKAIRNGVTKWKNEDAMIAACIYKACKHHNLPINVRMLSVTTGVTKKSINRAISQLMRALELNSVIIDPTSILPKYANNVGLSEKAKREAMRMLKHIEGKIESMGKPPSTLAACAVYASALRNKENVSQAALEKISHVTSVTIRKNYRTFLKT